MLADTATWSPPLLARRLRVPLREPDGLAVLGRVRRDTAATLAGWQFGQLAEAGCVIVDELLTNVIQHAPGTARASVALVVQGAGVRIEVSDRSPSLPVLRNPDGWDEAGRGLQLVAGLAVDWGARRTPAGKVVWAVLAVPGPPIYESVRRGLGATVPRARVNGWGG